MIKYEGKEFGSVSAFCVWYFDNGGELSGFRALLDKLDRPEPPFYWKAKAGLINIRDMSETHIDNILEDLNSRPPTLWTQIFEDELARRYN